MAQRAPAQLSSAPATASVTTTAALERVAGPGYEGWIRAPSPNAGPAGFAPSAAEIAALETALPAAARAAVERGEWPAEPGLATYARQYRGHRVADTAVIRVDLYCDEARHLAERTVTISHGGACFLHTAYEVESGRFRYFKRNPE